MKIPRKPWIVLTLLVILVLHTNVYAADALYRFMHNDHDALVIGEIISADENAVKVRVERGIISGKDLNIDAAKKQLKLVEAKITSSFSYNFFYNEDGSSKINPSAGDYVLLSLKKDGTGFKIAWGAYKVDSLDYKSLSVILPESPNVWAKMEAAAIKAFVNSDGKVNEFSFDGYAKTVCAGEEQTVIFDGSGEDEADVIPEDMNTTEASASMGIIGGADGPTSIYISGSPVRALIIPIVLLAVVILGIGFALVIRKQG